MNKKHYAKNNHKNNNYKKHYAKNNHKNNNYKQNNYVYYSPKIKNKDTNYSDIRNLMYKPYNPQECAHSEKFSVYFQERILCRYTSNNTHEYSKFCKFCKCSSDFCTNSYGNNSQYSHYFLANHNKYCEDCECNDINCDLPKMFISNITYPNYSYANKIRFAQIVIFGETNIKRSKYCKNHKCVINNCPNKKIKLFGLADMDYCYLCICINPICKNPKILPNKKSSDHYYCINCLAYILKSTWTPQTNVKYPKSMQISIKTFLLINKRFQIQHKLKIPKFVLYEIFKCCLYVFPN